VDEEEREQQHEDEDADQRHLDDGGVAQAAGKSAVYFAVTSAPAGKWFRVLSA